MQQEQQTPLMNQYHTIKAEYKDCLLMFQVGDFYEFFYDDAKQAAHFLGIALTKRGKSQGTDIPLCGVPLHAIDHYITKLVKGGFKVALCDQLEQPRPGTVVKRGVTRVLTPGTLTQDSLLQAKSRSHIAFCVENSLLFAELLATRLLIPREICADQRTIDNELARFFPDEIIVECTEKEFIHHVKKTGYVVSPVSYHEAWHNQELLESYQQWFMQKLDKAVWEQIQTHDAIKKSLFYFYVYLKKNNQSALDVWDSIEWYDPRSFLLIDTMTQKNLELVSNTVNGTTEKTLFACIDCAATAMGSRLLKQWLLAPLIDTEIIAQRQVGIACFVDNISLHNQIQTLLSSIGDLERVVGRILIDRAVQHDFIALQRALVLLPQLIALLSDVSVASNAFLGLVLYHCEPLDSLRELLTAAINIDTSVHTIIKTGFDNELDSMRSLMEHAGQEILALERAEQESTGIATLKIRYNDVHGYYLETTKLGAIQVPSYYKPLQSLVGKERFTIPALELLEHNIERAKKLSGLREKEIFEAVKKAIVVHSRSLRRIVFGLTNLDAISGLAMAAQQYRWNKPVLTDDRMLAITQGWHPVVAQGNDCRFVPNDTLMNNEIGMMLITGPNMGGKSTYLRQVALIAILAHIGSFVPAKSAIIMRLDRIFSRIGAGDNLAQGKSTFLVEMEETAVICHDATERSLVILDEVGRGTSTGDGMAIAQAVIEFLVTQKNPLVLFATHYHELTVLEQSYPTIKSYFAASTQSNGLIVFLYQIIPGVAGGSFGLQVARLAQLPEPIIERAAALLAQEQGSKRIDHAFDPAVVAKDMESGMMLNKIKALINSNDANDISPRKALDIIWQLHDILR